jgi:phosphoribosylformylglycinamidine synthase
MNAAVIVFPGSNREGDVARAIELTSGRKPQMVWHAETPLQVIGVDRHLGIRQEHL